MTNEPREVQITQADREAGWAFRPEGYGDTDFISWMRGDYDGNRQIQAFARHRLSHSPDKAVREALAGLFDRSPSLGASGDEPSLRAILFAYYAAHFPTGKAETLAEGYIAALADHPTEGAWRPIETAPKGQLIIGRRRAHSPEKAGYGYMIGIRYDLVRNALVDEWTGRWAECSHWMPLPESPSASPSSFEGEG